MVGHVTGLAGVEGEIVMVEVQSLEGSEFGFELLTGHSSRVLELTQTLVGEQMEISIRYDLFEGTLTAVSFHVLGTR